MRYNYLRLPIPDNFFCYNLAILIWQRKNILAINRECEFLSLCIAYP